MIFIVYFSVFCLSLAFLVKFIKKRLISQVFIASGISVIITILISLIYLSNSPYQTKTSEEKVFVRSKEVTKDYLKGEDGEFYHPRDSLTVIDTISGVELLKIHRVSPGMGGLWEIKHTQNKKLKYHLTNEDLKVYKKN